MVSSPASAIAWRTEDMAWRIHDCVRKGEIDNRRRGHVDGKIWLVGRDEPVTLDLSGNCSRDLAGCVVRFKNPRAKSAPEEHFDLAPKQTGVSGEITASRKIRVFDVPLG